MRRSARFIRRVHLLLCIGCASLSLQCERTYGTQACRLEKEILVASTDRAPTDVAVVANPNGGYLIAYSADDATFVAQLTNGGPGGTEPRRVPSPREKHRRLPDGVKTFWPATSHVSVSAEDLELLSLEQGSFLLTTLELSAEGTSGGAFATLIAADGKPEKTVRLGPAGEYGTEIAAVQWERNVLIVWHDGTLNASKLRFALLDPTDMTIVKQSEFRGKGPPSGPTSAMVDDRPFIVWAETGSRGDAAVSYVNTAWVSKDLSLSPPKTVAEGRFLFPSPNLISLDRGLGLTFRDDADKDDTPEFYYLALNESGGPAAEKKRISQADGFKGPSLEILGDYFVSAAVRSFQRNLLIGLNRFDKQGVKQNGEFQVYADKTDFVRVDVAGGTDAVMMIYAEDKRTSGRVLAGEVFCGERR